ncbi:MAG TPA: hypothetical protein VIY73_12285 [Polyangiaceae bacterium]
MTRPGIAKARGVPFVLARPETFVRAPDCRWRELFDRADVVSEGSVRDEDEGRCWYGSTSIILPVDDADRAGAEPALLAELVGRSAHVRLRALRMARTEACLRAPGRLGRITCEIVVAQDSRGVRIDVDVQAPLIERRAHPRSAR